MQKFEGKKTTIYLKQKFGQYFNQPYLRQKFELTVILQLYSPPGLGNYRVWSSKSTPGLPGLESNHRAQKYHGRVRERIPQRENFRFC